mgnify:CR=1 FL=1
MIHAPKSRWLATGGYLLAIFTLLVACLVACSPISQATPIIENTELPTPLSQATYTATPIPSVTPSNTQTPPANRLFIEPSIPQSLRDLIVLPASIREIENSQADYILTISDSVHSSRWVYALVAPFPTTNHGVNFQDIKDAWAGTSTIFSSGQPLLMSEDTQAVFATWWGLAGEDAVQVMPASDLLGYAWQHQPSWALIPFETIEPEWKVLKIDGVSPLDKEFDLEGYPLSVPIGVVDKNNTPLTSLPEGLSLPASNRDSTKLTVVAMTGVTALVRGTALWMERYGITYPAEDIGALLRQADITHISNEIPFSPECPFPSLPTPAPEDQPQPLISFCSSPAYFALLEEVGVDLIELTGDHFADWGDAAMKYTLDLYASHSLPVYGGGINAEQARQPLLIENNGNKLAFLGCNIGWPVRRDQIPESALATSTHPGAAQCDFEWLSAEIPRLRAEGYEVIFTFQHREYNRMKAEPILVEDFGKIASYGATVVSGSQAHEPHSMAFENGAFIHYGLGNLFFDQYHYCANYACDYGFIDRHIFYDNHYLGVELIPIEFIDLARPRLMTEVEASEYLEKIFTASGWFTMP